MGFRRFLFGRSPGRMIGQCWVELVAEQKVQLRLAVPVPFLRFVELMVQPVTHHLGFGEPSGRLRVGLP